ncbi:MAG: hypothetical protein Q9M21_05050 [Mariprofundaceae bacterium]|nr:hypothetical protein [Mariprofundaceae bacterium]
MTLFNDQKNDEHNWNKRQNKKSWGLYLSVGVICILLAWLLGSTG